MAWCSVESAARISSLGINLTGRTSHNANTSRHRQPAVGEINRFGQLGIDARGQARGVGSSRRFLDDDRELVGTEPGDHGALPGNQRLEPPSDRSQQQVTDALTEAVIDNPEAIQVDLAQRDSGTAITLEQRFEVDREMQPVGNPASRSCNDW